MDKIRKTFTNGIIKENPTLVLLLGTCPTLAMTTLVKNGIGMGLATTLALAVSNVVISLFRNVIPEKVRIPCYIVIIASVVTMVSFLLEAFLPDIYEALGIFLPLITVNCILLARAEMFAGKNNPFLSLLDGLGMGLGFTLALVLISSLREIIAQGTWLGMAVTKNVLPPISVLGLAPGAFFAFGVVVAVVNKLSKGTILKRKKEMGCAGCPSAAACAQAEGEGGEA